MNFNNMDESNFIHIGIAFMWSNESMLNWISFMINSTFWLSFMNTTSSICFDFPFHCFDLHDQFHAWKKKKFIVKKKSHIIISLSTWSIYMCENLHPWTNYIILAGYNLVVVTTCLRDNLCWFQHISSLHMALTSSWSTSFTNNILSMGVHHFWNCHFIHLLFLNLSSLTTFLSFFFPSQLSLLSSFHKAMF
jgi:hypothetical protein